MKMLTIGYALGLLFSSQAFTAPSIETIALYQSAMQSLPSMSGTIDSVMVEGDNVMVLLTSDVLTSELFVANIAGFCGAANGRTDLINGINNFVITASGGRSAWAFRNVKKTCPEILAAAEAVDAEAAKRILIHNSFRVM